MSYERDRRSGIDYVHSGSHAPLAPGRSTLTSRIQRRAVADATPAPTSTPTHAPAPEAGERFLDPFGIHLLNQSTRATLPIQTRATDPRAMDPEQVHAQAAAGVQGPGGAMPHAESIKKSFGRHAPIVDGIQAHVGGRAADAATAIGAIAFATGNAVAFQASPDLFTAAHEAAHVVQQRAGVHLRSGIGESGDAYEQNADAVATAVVNGESAEHLLICGTGERSSSVQRRDANHDGSHDAWEDSSAFRTPDDEVEVNWHQRVKWQDPGSAFVVRDVVPGNVVPTPDNAVLAKAQPHQHDDNDPIPLRSGSALPPVVLHHNDLVRRQAHWEAYAQAASLVQSMQEDIKGDFDRFIAAEKDPNLKALGLPGNTSKGSMTDLISQQQVPRGGLQVGELFTSDNMLNTSPQDQQAIATVADAAAQGHSDLEEKFLSTEASDSELQEKIAALSAAAHDVTASKSGLATAVKAIEQAAAERDKGAAAAELAQLAAESASVKSMLGFITTAPGKLISLAATAEPAKVGAPAGPTGGGVNPLSAAGTVASLLLDAVPDERMVDAQRKLELADLRIQDAKAGQLQLHLEAAKADTFAKIAHMRAARSALHTALTNRRKSYLVAGKAAGQAAVGPKASQDKVAGIIAAIPLVEQAVASLRNLVDKSLYSESTYSRSAGIGYGIALHHQFPEASALAPAIGTLGYIHAQYAEKLYDWSQRLTALLSAKEQIAGTHSEGAA